MTEKDYAPQKNEGKKMVVDTPKENKITASVKKEEKKVEVEKEVKIEDENKKIEEKKVEKPKVKKTEATINDTSHPISTKHAIALCKFVKGKKIENALDDLEKVVLKKKAVPMKGEIPHRKGMMSGRYPEKAAQHFIKMLNRLKANAEINEINNPMISLAVSNLGPKVYGRFGRTTKKRTHVRMVAIEKPESKSGGKK
ncbi:MAG: uL22 family ribosomal protein [Candidatus Pacearchaeota archaeon]